MFDLVVLQENSLVLVVVKDVPLTLCFVVPYPVRPPAGFLIDFEPGVDIIFEEPFLDLRETPHLVDVLDFVAQLDRFVQLGGAPRTGQDSLVIGVSALVGSLQRGFDHFFFHTGSA